MRHERLASDMKRVQKFLQEMIFKIAFSSFFPLSNCEKRERN